MVCCLLLFVCLFVCCGWSTHVRDTRLHFLCPGWLVGAQPGMKQPLLPPQQHNNPKPQTITLNHNRNHKQKRCCYVAGVSYPGGHCFVRRLSLECSFVGCKLFVDCPCLMLVVRRVSLSFLLFAVRCMLFVVCCCLLLLSVSCRWLLVVCCILFVSVCVAMFVVVCCLLTVV